MNIRPVSQQASDKTPEWRDQYYTNTSTPSLASSSKDIPTAQSAEKSQKNRSVFPDACKINAQIETITDTVRSNKVLAALILAPTALLTTITPLTIVIGKLLAQNVPQKLDKMDHEQITDLKKQMELFDNRKTVLIDGTPMSLQQAKKECALLLSTPYQIQNTSYIPSDDEIIKFQANTRTQIYSNLIEKILLPDDSTKNTIDTLEKQRQELEDKLLDPITALKNQQQKSRTKFEQDYHERTHKVTIDGKQTTVMMIKAELKKLLEFSDISEESTETEVSVQQPPLSLEEWSQKALSFQSALQEADVEFFAKQYLPKSIDKTAPETSLSKDRPLKNQSIAQTPREKLLDSLEDLKQQKNPIENGQRAASNILAFPLLLLGASVTGVSK